MPNKLKARGPHKVLDLVNMERFRHQVGRVRVSTDLLYLDQARLHGVL